METITKDRFDFLISVDTKQEDNVHIYSVSVADSNDIKLEAYYYETGDYVDALQRARLFFLRLKEPNPNRRIDSFLDSPISTLVGQSCYCIDDVDVHFLESALDTLKSWYREITEEIYEEKSNGTEVNIAFRNAVNKHHLNRFQEKTLVKYYQRI